MGASKLTHRITGVSGVGMSYGLYKPDTSTGCNCGKSHPEPEIPRTKTICSTRISVGGVVSISSGQTTRIKTCN